jgi:hypothetical protein
MLGLWGLLAFASTARAEGPGIALGDRLVLHLGLGVEVRYDSNLFFEDKQVPNGDNTFHGPTDAFMLRILPSIDLATRPSQRGGTTPHMIDFRLHAGADYNEYLSASAGITRHRDAGAQIGGLLTILPFGQFTIDIYDNYVRTAQLPYTNLANNLDRDVNEVGIRGRYRPGGGRLEFDLSYTFGLDFWEQQEQKDLNVLYHRLNLRGMWKFLPKTAVYLDITETPYIYLNNNLHDNSYPLRIIAGLNGLLTTKLRFNLWIGYGNAFFQYTAASTAACNAMPPMKACPSFNLPIAGLELGWRPTLLSSGIIGYRWDFVNSPVGEYNQFHMAYLTWIQQFWRFTGTVMLRYQNNHYEGLSTNAGNVDPMGVPITDRIDNFIAFDARVDYPFKDWLIMSLGYDLQYNVTDAKLGSAGAAATQIIPLNYLKNEVWLRLAVLY